MPVTVSSQSSPPSHHAPQPWHKTLAQPAKEFGTTPLKVIDGSIPEGLRGAFYQNGTGRLQRGGEPVGHWFDGDGAILRVAFTDGGATGTYRYVRTEGYQRESEADKFLYGNYGMRYPGPLWKYMTGLFTGMGTGVKNSANTSVLALPDKLLALWEAGNPHSLDLETLETFGKASLGWLREDEPFSAHPLRDPLSGEIYNIGVGSKGDLTIYRCDSRCTLLKKTVIALTGMPLVHSFVMAGPYLVFLIAPMTVNLLPLLFNRQSYAESIEWQPEHGTRIVVVDRESLEIVSEGHAEPWFQWHFGNGCVEGDGTVRLDFTRFDDFGHINEVLREIPAGRIKTVAYGRLWQLRLDPKRGRIVSNECVMARDCEFPQVPAAKIGQPWQSTYLVMHRDGVSTGQDWFGAIGRFDYSSGEVVQADLGEGHYSSEPLHVMDRLNPKQGWLLDVVYSAVAERSELWILDAKTLAVVCQLALPAIVPLGFHGTWQVEPG